jgi:hypothetical protein
MAVPVRGPVPGARFVVEFAAERLPTPANRRRYQAEFVAELYGEPALVQYRRAFGVLSRSHALRAALKDARLPLLTQRRRQPLGRRLRCRVLRWHSWAGFSTDDGGRYSACAVCGKDRPDRPHWASGGLMHGITGGGGAVGGI